MSKSSTVVSAPRVARPQFTAFIEDGILHISAPIKPKMSSTGKQELLVCQHGFDVDTEDGRTATIGLNLKTDPLPGTPNAEIAKAARAAAKAERKAAKGNRDD